MEKKSQRTTIPDLERLPGQTAMARMDNTQPVLFSLLAVGTMF